MSKELEALNKIQHDFGQLKGQELVSCYETIFNALKRLEAIDNSNPSEALVYIDTFIEENNNDIKNQDITGFDIDTQAKWVKYLDNKSLMLSTIKQALLKAQEPKKYLKWEDLEFKEDNEAKIKVRMGEHIYDLWYGSYKTGYGTFKQKCSLAGYEFDEDYDIDFFNDLHLERVEE